MATQSTTQERKVYAYPSPKYHKLLTDYCDNHEVSKSDVICSALKAFFDALNPPKHTQRPAHKSHILE